MKSTGNKKFLFVDVHTEPAPYVDLQPQIRVYRWRTYRHKGESRQVCEIPETGRIRVTTPIAHWNPASGKLVTDSGRVYELIGSEVDHAIDFALALVEMGLGMWL